MDDLSAVLERLDVPLGVAEAQGLACGLLCSRPASNAKSRWFSELLDAAALVPEALAGRAADLRALDEWFGAEIAALNDVELDFAPSRCPTTSAPLDRRVRALGEFCAGFVYGVGNRRRRPRQPGAAGRHARAPRGLHGDRRWPTTTARTRPTRKPSSSSPSTCASAVLLVNEELKPVTPAPPSRPGAAPASPGAPGGAGPHRVH